jgi:glycosyltransferase involved in cell wall biosynthesis
MTTAMPDGAQPRITIVTPSFNQGRFLEQAIRSVLDQGYPNLEYIVIDGGSTDNSLEIIRKYADRLHYWCSEPDQGQYHAINKGFSHATGDILAWLNSDDMYCPGAFQIAASVFRDFPEVQWLSSLAPLQWDRHGNRAYEGRIPGFSKAAFLDGVYFGKRGYTFGYIQQESTFWTRSLWHVANGLSIGYSLAADFDLWCRFYRLADLYGVDAELAGFRSHDRNRSSDRVGYREEAVRSLGVLRKETGWKGLSVSRRIVDALCSLPFAGRPLTRLVAKTSRPYRAVNFYRDGGPADSAWNRRVVCF